MKYPLYDTVEDIFELPWILATLFDVPAKPGVYMLKNKYNGEIEYIGQSSKMRYRLGNASHPVFNLELHTIRYVLIEDEKLRKYTEYRAIELLHPILNHRNGLFPENNQDLLDAGYDAIFN